MAELKPCPFCGGEAIINKKRDAIGSYYSVACKETNLCSGHFIRTKHYNQKSDAIDAWNTRANEKGGAEE